MRGGGGGRSARRPRRESVPPQNSCFFIAPCYNIGMNKFKYKFSTPTLVFIGLGIALAIAGAVLNTYNIFADKCWTYASPSIYIIRYVLIYFVAVALIVIMTSLLLSSYYSVDDKYFYTAFGIIRSKFDIKSIVAIVLDRETNRLSVFFSETQFTNIVVKPEWNDKFVDAILKANPLIEYTIKSKENRGDDEKKD